MIILRIILSPPVIASEAGTPRLRAHASGGVRRVAGGAGAGGAPGLGREQRPGPGIREGTNVARPSGAGGYRAASERRPTLGASEGGKERLAILATFPATPAQGVEQEGLAT